MMLGFSVFLNEDIDYGYLDRMVEAGFKGIFTSVHIPEDDTAYYNERIEKLADYCRENKLEFVVDTSADRLSKLGVSIDKPEDIRLKLGFTTVRADFGINNKAIANMSNVMKVALNASTITRRDIIELEEHSANFNNLEAWHNYYPRPSTGLDEEYFVKQNSWLKSAGFTVMAFVPGDDNYRGPIYKGLPTLESHRDKNVLATIIDLKENYYVDKVYIADPGLTNLTYEQVKNFNTDGTILLRVSPILSDDKLAEYNLNKRLVSRPDVARDIIRDVSTRTLNNGLVIEQESVADISIDKGTVAIVNDKYPRYKGEVQILKQKIPTDGSLNVIGKVYSKDIELLPYIGSSDKYQFIWR